MPSGTINGSTGNQYIDSKIVWSYTQNTSANTSTVTATLYYKRNNSGFSTSGTGNFTITIDGSIYKASKYLSITELDWTPAIAATKTITHNGDGTRSVKISATGSIPNTSLTSTSCSGSITLATIPRASTISAAYAVTLGTRCKIVWTPASASFYYKVKFAIGTWSYTTDAFKPGITTAYTYTGYPVPMDVASNFPNSPSGTMTATLYTYSDNGSTQVGSPSSKTFTVTLPDNEDTKPSVLMSLSPEHSLGEKFSKLYIQGKSKVKADVTTSGEYGATVPSYSISIDGTNYQSTYLSTPGDKTVVVKATDSRGYSNTDDQDIHVIPYNKPKLVSGTDEKEIICARCDESGNIVNSGTYLKIKVGRSYSKVMSGSTQMNYCLLRYRYKAATATNFSDYYNLIAQDASTDYADVIVGNVVTSVTTSYVVELSVKDDIGETSAITFTVPTGAIDFHLRDGGGGAAFGKYSEKPKALELADDWDIYYKGKKLETPGDIVIEEGTAETKNASLQEATWYYRKWSSGKAECWTRFSVTVNIHIEWGAIYYTTKNGPAYPSGLFTDAPMCQITAEFGNSMQAAWLATYGESTKDYTPTVAICRPLAAEAGFDILYYAIGNWK